MPREPVCKLRSALFNELPLDHPARTCVHSPPDCSCNKADPLTGFCNQRIPSAGVMG